MPSDQSREAWAQPGPGWTIAAAALVTGALGILVLLAPVTADDPVVS